MGKLVLLSIPRKLVLNVNIVPTIRRHLSYCTADRVNTDHQAGALKALYCVGMHQCRR